MTAPTLWLDRPGPAVMAEGLRRDQYQQHVWDEHEANVERPPCPACGAPVADSEWNAHVLAGHGLATKLLDYGRPDAREALFVAADRDELDANIVMWRRRHPGVQLLPLAEGRDPDGDYLWVRFAQRDRRGRPGR